MKLQQRASRCCAGNPPRREAQPQIKARCLASQTQSIRRPRFSGYLRPGTPNRVRQIASAPLLLDLDDSFASKIAASMKFDIEDWLPKSAILLRHYDRHKFASDLIAGVTVGLVALPLAMAFGMKMGHVPGDFLHVIKETGRAANTVSRPATAVSIYSVGLMVFCLKYAKKIPGAILVTFGATAAVILFLVNLETIGTRFGGIPKGLPTIAVPKFHYDIFRQLLSSAFTVAMLGAIESLMSAVVSDRMSNDKHNPNVELIGQGVANILSPLFGGLPATGAIARTATNVRSGAKTPVAGMIHALTLLGIILFAAPLVKSVPLAALASILMIVAYNMGDWEEIPEILKLSAADIAVWLLTMVLRSEERRVGK